MGNNLTITLSYARTNNARKKVAMAAQKTITINGREYDALTGLPVDATKTASSTPKPAPASKPSVAKHATRPVAKPVAKSVPRGQTISETVHGNVQKSKTLMRRATKKPAATQKIVRRPQAGRHMDISRNTSVSKFAPHPVIKEVKTASASPVKPSKPMSTDKPARVHPVAERALQKAGAKKAAQQRAAKPATTKDVKDAATYADIDGFASARATLTGDFADFDREVTVSGDPKQVDVNVYWTVKGQDQSVNLVTLFTNYDY